MGRALTLLRIPDAARRNQADRETAAALYASRSSIVVRDDLIVMASRLGRAREQGDPRETHHGPANHSIPPVSL
jgi:hypothetical protein